MTIAGLTISHGFAVQGGGIDNLGKLTVSSCVLSDNMAAGGTGQDAVGGGLFNEAGAKLTMSYTIFTHNQALGGDGGGGSGGYGIGGGFDNRGIASVDHSAFTDNLAQGGAGTSVGVPFVGFGVGGGIDNEHGGALTITASTFTDNRAVGGQLLSGSAFLDGIGSGGAIANGAVNEFLAPTLTVTDSTFIGNRAIGGTGDPGVVGGQAAGRRPRQRLRRDRPADPLHVQWQPGPGRRQRRRCPGERRALGGAIFNQFGGATVAINDSTFTDNLGSGRQRGSR